MPLCLSVCLSVILNLIRRCLSFCSWYPCMAYQLSWVLPKLPSLPLYFCLSVSPSPLFYFLPFISKFYFPQKESIRNYRFMEPIGLDPRTKPCSFQSFRWSKCNTMLLLQSPWADIITVRVLLVSLWLLSKVRMTPIPPNVNLLHYTSWKYFTSRR